MLRRLLTIALLGAALAAPLPASAGTEPDPHFEEPTVGECRQYGIAAASQQTESSAPVGCRTKHTAKVFKVFQLPADMDWRASVSELSALVSKKCNPAFKTWMGRDELTVALTAYTSVWFTPTQAQKDAGARWMRCDIVALKSKGLAPLTKNKAPMIPKPLTNSVRRCLNGSSYLITVCSAKHQWKAAGDFTMAKGRYPSTTKFRNVAASRCRRLVTTRSYVYTYPSKAQWTSGYRIMICHSKTTR